MKPFEAEPSEPPGGHNDRLVPWPEVKKMTGLSRSTAWRRGKAGDFPLSVQISPGRVGWWESELTAWKVSRAPRGQRQLPAFRQAVPPPSEPRTATVSEPLAEPDLAKPEHPSRRPRARKRSVCEGQIAFRF